ncbi:hypothetical protein D9M69_539160 [compost metagenome]
MQKTLCNAATRERNHQNTGALAARTTSTARTVKHGFSIVWQIGMDNQIKVWQIDTTCSNVGCHANAGTTIAHCLKRIVTLGLAQFTRQRHNRKPAIGKAARHVLYCFAGRAEDD